MSVHMHVLLGDLGALKKIIASGKSAKKDLNRRHDRGFSPLHEAVAQRSRETLDLLAKCPLVDVNIQDIENGFTPLHLVLYELIQALYTGYLELAFLLISTRSDLDLSIKDNDGYTALDVLNVLGHSNGTDRAFPERIHVPCASKGPLAVTQQTLAKHQPEIQEISMGKYHTAMIADSLLFMHGFGAKGRLGLGSQESSLIPTLVPGLTRVRNVALGYTHTILLVEDGKVYTFGSNEYGQLGYEGEDQATPKEVLSLRKRQNASVKGVAASKYHSAVYFDSGVIYTWGYDNGQLGYKVKGSKIQQTPRMITDFPAVDIKSIAATNSSTAVLAENDVIVFSQGSCRKVQFSFPEIAGLAWAYRRRKVNKIVKIVSGCHQYAAITFDGDVLVWSPFEAEQYADTWQQINFPQSKPRMIWNAREERLSVVDVAIGIDSSILLCTRNGHVFLGRRYYPCLTKSTSDKKAKKKIFKYERIKGLSNIVKVSASLSGGYAAVRRDNRTFDVDFAASTYTADIAKLVKPLRDGISLPSKRDASVVCKDTGRKFPVHRAILAVQSDELNDLLKGKTSKIVDNYGNTLISSNRRELYVHSTCEEAVLDLIEFMYTRRRKSFEFDNDGVSRRTYDQYIRLLPHLGLSTKWNPNNETLKSKMSALKHSETKNVIIKLFDGEIMAHAEILATRCSFFEPILGDFSRWTTTEENGLSVVHLTSIRKEDFEKILQWIYEDTNDQFGDSVLLSVGEYEKSIVRILKAADELLLDQIKLKCESLLCGLLSLENAIEFLQLSRTYSCAQLQRGSLGFRTFNFLILVCSNLDYVIESGMYRMIDPRDVRELEQFLHERLRLAFPFTRGDEGFHARIREEAKRMDESQKKKKNKKEKLTIPVLSHTSPSPKSPFDGIFCFEEEQEVGLEYCVTQTLSHKASLKKTPNRNAFELTPELTPVNPPETSPKSWVSIEENSMSLTCQRRPSLRSIMENEASATQRNKGRSSWYEASPSFDSSRVKGSNEVPNKKIEIQREIPKEKTSLRDIMAREKSHSQSREKSYSYSQSIRAISESPGPSRSSDFLTVKHAGMSQKERKRKGKQPEKKEVTNPWDTSPLAPKTSFLQVQEEQAGQLFARQAWALKEKKPLQSAITKSFQTSWSRMNEAMPAKSLVEIQNEEATQKLIEKLLLEDGIVRM